MGSSCTIPQHVICALCCVFATPASLLALFLEKQKPEKSDSAACHVQGEEEPRAHAVGQGAVVAARRRWSLPENRTAHQTHIPDRQALRRNAKAKDRAARDPTRARPSTPLPGGRELRGHTERVVTGVSQRKRPQQIRGIINAGIPTKKESVGFFTCPSHKEFLASFFKNFYLMYFVKEKYLL